ncbi:MAG TPA: hypothetical protein VFF30_16245, partial [Nitrososphaerales archaeon]|nr:hypothetical protein [Nitrososphaerales archaeon]
MSQTNASGWTGRSLIGIPERVEKEAIEKLPTLLTQEPRSTASYNYQNNTVTATDEDGHKTIYAYDWTKKDLLWVREYNSSSSYYL